MRLSLFSVVRPLVHVVPFAAAFLSIPTAGFATPILAPALASFAVLGETSVTNVATSTIVGNVGVSAGSSITGFTVPVPGVGTLDATGQITGGMLHATTPLAAQAQLDLDAAIFAINSLALTATIGPDLTGTIFPGVYDVLPGPVNLSGALVLDGNGFGNTAFWAFRFPGSGTLVTSTTSTVSFINIGDGANVGLFWNVGSAATLNGPTFAGNVLAQTKISSDGNLTMTCGRLLDATAAVTLIKDTISIGCAEFADGLNPGDGGVGGTGGGGGGGGGGGAVPEPASLTLLASGLVGAAKWRRRRIGSGRP